MTRTNPAPPNTGSWSLAPASWPEARATHSGAAVSDADADDEGESTQAWSAPLAEPANAQPASFRAAPPQPTPPQAAPDTTSTSSAPTAEYRPPAGPPSRIYVPRPVVPEPLQLSQAIPVSAPPRVRRRHTAWLYALAAVVVIAIIAGLAVLGLRERDDATAAPPTNDTSTSAATFAPKLSTFTTKGTGFRAEGDQWVTQTYTTPEFGGLKPGIGLVLDLNEAQRVSEIDFTAQTGPLTVDLRSADTLPTSLDDWHKEGSATQATGATALNVTSTEKHRYWMIWVTKLGTGNKAVVGGVKVLGSK